MSVEFEENNDLSHFRSRSILGTPETPKMVNLLMKYGIADEQKAGYTLLGIIGLLLILSAIVIYTFVLPEKPKVIFYEELSPEVKAALPPSYINTIPHKND